MGGLQAMQKIVVPRSVSPMPRRSSPMRTTMVQQTAAPAVPTSIAEYKQVSVPTVAATQVIAECRRQQIVGVTTANMSPMTAIAKPVAVAGSESVSDGSANFAVAADERKAEGYVDSRVTRIATRTW